ncbi:unnamed protein product, partial [Coregonus sp. 'balchen']
MTMAEKRRAGGTSGMSEAKPTKTDTEREFLSQAGVGELLRGALLKMVEARSEDPVGFLADHFCNLASETENGMAGCCSDGDMLNLGAGAHEQQQLSRALWHLRLAHHSQSGEEEWVPVAPLVHAALTAQVGGSGADSTHTPSSEGGVPISTSAPLLRRLHCQDHEAVPYDVFRHGVLTCAVFSDYIRRAQRLYAEVCDPAEGPAGRALCLAVLGTLHEALETSRSDGGSSDANHYTNANAKANPYLEANTKVSRYLEASAKISPGKLAQAMSGAEPAGVNMDAKEFEDAAAELFIAR